MSFKSMDTLLEQINASIQKLKNGELLPTEIDGLLGDVTALQERLIILRYKAFEESLKSDTPTQEPVSTTKFSLNEQAIEPEKPLVENVFLHDFEPIEENTQAINPNQISIIDAIKEIELDNESTDTRLTNFIAGLKGGSKHTNPVLSPLPQAEKAPTQQTPSLVKTEKAEPQVLVSDLLRQSNFLEQKAAPVPSTIAKETKPQTTLHKLPIGDLNSAVGLNQRVLFIKELFNQNHDEFTSSINKLNNFDDLEEATNFINAHLVPLFKWDFEHKNVIDFMELVERRYL